MKEANKITEGALLTAIYIVLLLIVLFVPFIFLFGLVILPIPFIVYAERYDYKPALMMFLVALILTALFATIVSLPLTLLAGIGGITIGTALYRQRKPYEVWARGTISFISAIIVIILMMQFALDLNIYTETEKLINESFEMTKSTVEMLNLDIDAEQLALLQEQMSSFPDLLPAAIAIMSIFISLATLWLSFKTINRTRQKDYRFPPFRQFSLPKGIIWIYILSLVGVLFVTDAESVWYIAALNGSMLFITLFIIQGFSFVFFLSKEKKWHPSVPIIIVIFSILIPFISMIIMRIIGIIDVLFNLKERLAQTNGG